MEEGQKIDINLESPLDTKTSDMLVSVQDTTFAHNRQKFQGHVLPTSLRYERNGWAAGWYVYDFKMGGGNIFSKNSTPVIEGGEWLAASRSKINNTPTYVISFYTARNDTDSGTPDTRDELKQYADAVRDIQFQAWFTDTASINARECEEANITAGVVPELSFNYAVEGHDYRNVIRFTPYQNLVNNGQPAGVRFDPDNCFSTLSPDAEHSADLTMEFVDRAEDGTVSAILNNNDVHWVWSDTVCIPKDLVDSEGNVFGKFTDVSNGTVSWKLGSETLQYIDAQGVFVYNNVSYNPQSTLSINYTIPLTYTIPINKYYSAVNNITWSVQGTRVLINNEDNEDPTNMYKISIPDGSDSNVSVFNGDLANNGFNGPDISVVSQAEIDLSTLPEIETPISFNGQARSNVRPSEAISDLPIATIQTKSFKMPNEDTARDVTIQLYLRFSGDMSSIGVLDGRYVYVVPYGYKSAIMATDLSLKEVFYGDRESRIISYKLDGNTIPATATYPANITSNIAPEYSSHIAYRDIIGWKANLKLKITGINGVIYSDQDDTLDINTDIVCNNIAFTYNISGQYWIQFDPHEESQQESGNGNVHTETNLGAGNVYASEEDKEYHSAEDGDNQYYAKLTNLGFKLAAYMGSIPDITVTPYLVTAEGDVSSWNILYSGAKLTFMARFSYNNERYIIFKAEWYRDTDLTGEATYIMLKENYMSCIFTHRVDRYNNWYIAIRVSNYYSFPILSPDSVMQRWTPLVNIADTEVTLPCRNSEATVVFSKMFVLGGAIYGLVANSDTILPIADLTGNVTTNFDIPGLATAAGYCGIWVDSAEHTFIIGVYTTPQQPARAYFKCNYARDTNYYLGSGSIANGAVLKTSLANHIVMDVIDNITGELLIDHKTADVQTTEESKLEFTFDSAHLCKGKLFFNNTVDCSLEANSSVISANKSRIYRYGAVSNALFPISVYRENSGSVYDSPDSIFSQGIAVYNIDGKYIISILSDASKYIIPPKVTGDTLCIYAARTFTHHIRFTDNVTLFNHKLLSDALTDVSQLDITPRSSLYDAACETNNKYYVEDSTFLAPAAISYYNNQWHITYKPRSGNYIIVAGTPYDSGASDMSIRQDADLVVVYLLKYTDAATKYNFVIGDHDSVVQTAETKEIINTIADTNKHWVTAQVSNIVWQNNPIVTVRVTENHDDGTVITRDITYTSALQFNDNFINREFSNDTQFVIDTAKTGVTSIGLPAMPQVNSFKYNVSNNEVSVVDALNAGNHFKYRYTDNKVLEMFIKGKELAKAAINVSGSEVFSSFDKYTVSVNQNINTLVYFKHYGFYKILGIQTGTITPRIKELQYNPQNKHEFSIKVSDLVYIGRAEAVPVGVNETYTLDYNHFDNATECTPKYLDYFATDVRNDNPDTQTKRFARVMAENEYQLIKQHWNSTVAVENYWWIDESHTLELTKDRFILKSKVIDGSYDDWMGDKWEVVYEVARTDFITSEADTVLCSSASGQNARGYLYILQPVNMNTIKLTIYDPLTNMQKLLEKSITFEHVELGTKKKHIPLNSVNDCSTDNYVVGTYSDIVASSLLADSKLSAVCINGVHWLGIQYDKNFNQWSFAFGSVQKIIHGYGCVGINGYATGGMLPGEYFSNNGFNSSVYSVKELEAEEDQTITDLATFNEFKERVVGDENQQWYISKELQDIVMAVNLKNSDTVKLPITNNYAQIYSSPSYVKYTVHALGIQIKQLLNLFGDDDNAIWKEIIKYAMFPLVWYLSPYTNVINYLQQTLGQYAFVHYNSTSIGKQSSKLFEENTDGNAGLSEDPSANHIDALVTDDLSFDVVHIPQEQSFKDSAWDNVLGIFASMVVSATDYAMKDLTVNSLQNQSAVSDIGKKFSQSFLQNIGSMSVTGFNMQSTKPMLKSEVTAVKTLDMFYSTSAQQNCYAGPGYVNMQFVAQCTAQSVTSVQLEAQQTQVFMLLRQLTTWQGKATIFVLDQLKDFMFKMSDNMSQGLTAGPIVGLGWIPALVASAVGYALVAAKALVKLGIETVDSMLDSFFQDGIKTNVTAQLSRHNYDIEGKHAYGNKSECFMWPCADCTSKLYTDEKVEAVLQDKSWPLEMPKASTGNLQSKPVYSSQPKCFTITPGLYTAEIWEGKVPYSIAMCKGTLNRRALPNDTAYVVGTETFMPNVPFKNENIGEGEPVFTPPPVQDYIINKNWNLMVTAMAGDALWVSCKDTKLFDGNYSNIVVTDSFCGVAAPHIAVEIKRNICEEYLRPWAVSPDAIALNITGLNCAYDEVAYHAFDGYGYRITDWLGSSGMNKEHYTLQYCFQINDRFKRSNKLPPNQFMGNFQAVPSMSLDVKDKIFNDIQVTTEERGLRTGVAGENKDTQRYSLPIFTEQISSLPAIVRALSPYKLAVIDGITSLTTDVRSSQSVYKIPDSVDFNINDKLYRMTNEYICSVDHEKGLEVVRYLVPALGLTYLGATPFMAYFYNQATRQYFIYQGGNTLQVMDMLERFRDIKSGIYDFINQEVVMPCLATMSRLDKRIKDDADETDNIVIPVFRHNKVGGELTPPITTIFNTESWYRTISTPAGLVFQGPNRCIINRFVWSQYMLKDIKANKGKWKKVPREEYHPFREYSQHYETMPRRIASDAVKGWTHNPFLLVTSPLGVNEETDCKFEWEITFAWTTEMEQLYEHDEYVTVNVMAETMTPGGKVFSRPTHIFLHKELFTRTGNFGYYSFRYQSNCGAGNRERLHIWSDGYIAVSSLQLEYKVMSSKRSEILVTQEDIKGMKEM